MVRYQVGWSSLHRHGMGEEAGSERLAQALKDVGAKHVRLRHGYGWRNQPRTPTFSAEQGEETYYLTKAAERLGLPEPRYAFSAYTYTKTGE